MYGNCAKGLRSLMNLFRYQRIVLSSSLSTCCGRTCDRRYHQLKLRFVSLSSRNSIEFLLWMREFVMFLPARCLCGRIVLAGIVTRTRVSRFAG